MNTFETFLEKELPEFRDMNGNKIANLGEYARQYMFDNADKDIQLFLGTDSNPRHFIFVTALLFYNVGKGAHMVYHKEKWPRDKPKRIADRKERKKQESWNIQWRLRKELEMTYAIAEYLEMELEGFVDRIGGKKLVDIDIDINSEFGDAGENKSNLIYQEGIGMFEGSGYRIRAKPFSFASTVAADKMAK